MMAIIEAAFNEDQLVLAASVSRFLENEGGARAARVARTLPYGFDAGRWAKIAAAGWLATLVPPERGGLGLGMSELAIILEQCGQHLVCEPVAAAACSAWLLGSTPAGTATLPEGLLQSLITQGALVTPVIPPNGDNPLRFSGSLEEGFIDGRLASVADVGPATALLVATESGSGPVIVCLERNAAGMSIRLADAVDGCPLAEIVFERAPVCAAQVLASGAAAERLLGGCLARLRVAAAAELAGLSAGTFALAVDYLKQRKQFGRPIGSFQAMKHAAVDDLSELFRARALLHAVARAMSDGARTDGDALAAALKSFNSRAGLRLCKSCIQMHGAMGYTDEHDAGLFLKRAMSLAARHGNAGVCEAAFEAAFAGLGGAIAGHPSECQ